MRTALACVRSSTLWLLLLLASPVFGQDYQLHIDFPTVAGVDAYAVYGQRVGDPGWTLVAARNAADCPSVPANCRVSFPPIAPAGLQCFRLTFVTMAYSIPAETAGCWDPIWGERPPTPASTPTTVTR